MAVLQSLLSGFRKSRQKTRKMRRDVSGQLTTEALEPRLLLTNPDPFSSAVGAPKTIYLDFDGHVETAPAWTGLAIGNGFVDTPAFSLDNDPTNFSELERKTIEEIFLRVAEDFAPFGNVNVTTVDPGVYATGDTLLVSIGGYGNTPIAGNPNSSDWWSTRNYNHALVDGFNDTTNSSTTVFVFARDYASHPATSPTGRPGQIGRDVANGVSEAVGIAMGLSERTVQGNTEESHLVGSGTFALGLRDTWSNVPAAGAAQDDLAEITKAANGITFAADDHGNTIETATAITIGNSVETIRGKIAANDDVDVFAFSSSDTVGTFTLQGLDLTTRLSSLFGTTFGNDGVTNPGSNLDPVLRLLDANGVEVAMDDQPFAVEDKNSLTAAFTANLTAGNYYLEVSNRSEYGNLGEYSITIDGVDTQAALPVPPQQSNAGAPVTLFLDFNGHVVSNDEVLAQRVDGISQPFYVPVYDTDGDRTTFSPEEQAEISEIWARVAEDFYPYDVNVTTSDPFVYNNRQGLLVAVGGDGSWQVTPLGTGFAELNTFNSGTDDNNAVVFSDNLSSPKETALEISATIANALGIETYIDQATGLRVAGFAAIGPIGGNSAGSLRDVFLPGPGATPTSPLQDPVAVITNSANRIAFRPDQYGDTSATAQGIVVSPAVEVVRGVIERRTDEDWFSFQTLAANADISITGLDLTVDALGAPVPGITNPGANFDPVIELYRDIAGTPVLVAADGDFPFSLTDSDPATLKARVVAAIPAGLYYIRVSNRGEYENVGQYTITINGVDGTPAVVSFNPNTISENAGVVAGVGRVDRPAGQPPGAPLVVTLVSTDTTELIVPPTVTIPANQTFVTFGVEAVDDNILDGDQNVEVQAYVLGVLNSTANMKVTDFETITATVNPDPVREDAGAGGATLTITRSNTDIAAANHWVGSGNTIEERDPTGQVLRTIQVPWPVGPRPAGEIVHDIQVLQNGNIAVYNGTGSAFLSVYNVTLGTWRHFAEPGLSANTSQDETIGGLASVGDFVFLTDLESFDGDQRGIVRINTLTGQIDRFADASVGSRLFYLAGNSIVETHAVTGEILGLITPQATLGSLSTLTALTFDGNNLWAVFRAQTGASLIEMQKLNPDTGAVLEVHSIPLPSQNSFFGSTFIGITALNDRIYFNLPFVNNTFSAINRVIQAYNPATRQFASGLIPVDSLNSIVIGPTIGSLKGDGTAANPDVLLFHGYPDVFGTGGFGNDRVYMINPLTGRVVGSFATGLNTAFLGFFSSSGIEGMDDVSRDGTVLNGLIYLNIDDQILVFDRSGNRVDMDLSTAFPNGVPHTFQGFDPYQNVEIAGGDVPGLVAQELSFRDVSIGIDDDLVYGLVENGSQISVYTSDTLIFVRNIFLDAPVNTISVDEDGQILGGGANGDIRVFDADGTTISTLTTTSFGLSNVADVETNISREVIISDANGVVIIGPRDAVITNDPTQFVVDSTVNAATTFASFGRHTTLQTGPVVVTLTSNDLSELEVPVEVLIPVGQASVSIPIDVIDDNMLDGPQQVTVTGAARNYMADATVVTVSDAEQVGVEIFPDVVAETDGLLPNQIRIFRSDIDGPFDVPESTFGEVTTPLPISDKDVTLSQITLVDQISRVTDVDVMITLQHAFIPDLDIALVSPQGTRVQLIADLGSNETHMTNTIFDDEAATRIRDGVAPYTGRFIGKELLSKFDGEDPSGTWTLEITDDNVTDVGTLLAWSLDIDTIGISETQVTLISSDTTEGTVTTTVVTIPAAREEVFIDFTAIDDTILDGTQTVTVSVDTMNVVGFDKGMDTVDVTDVETLQISLDKLVVSEGDGPNAINGTVTRSDTDMSQPLTVTLTSSDITELAVPPTVVIPIGQASASFVVDAVDDFDFDGDQTVTIDATAGGYFSTTSDVVTVTDQEPRLVLTTLTPVIDEDAGTITISLSRVDANDLNQPQSVTLQSSDLTELTVPTSLVIGIGQVSTTFVATIQEDTLLDGPQTVTITASDPNVASPSVNSGTLDITVQDAEFVSITVPQGQNSFLENAGDAVATGTVSVSSIGHTQAIIVSLTNSDPSEISIPTEVLIPVGASSATFQINAVNDSFIDRDQHVTVTGVATGFRNGVLNLTVQDHEPPIPMGPDSVTEDSTPTLTWEPVGGATRYDLWVNDVSRGIVQLFRRSNLPADQTSFTPIQELGVGRYRYWVRAYDDLEQPGFWSEALDFQIRTRPKMVSPTNQSFVASAAFPEISWTTVVDTDRYDLWVNNLTTGQSQVIRETNLTTTSFASQANLPGGTYRAWARASVVDNVFTAQNQGVPVYVDGFWSSPITFTVLSSPTNVRPSGATFDRTPQIEWDPVEGAENYYVWVTLRNPGETPVVVLRDRFVVGTSRIPETDLENGRYAVWVKAVAADGTESAWSPATEFTIGGRPNIIAPADDSTTSSTPTFLWTGVTGAERYEFWMDRTDVPQSKVVYNANVQTTSLQVTTPLAAGTYRVWIRAISEMGENSYWSRPVDITVVSNHITSPAGETPVSSEPLLAVWSAVPDVEVGSGRYVVSPVIVEEPTVDNSNAQTDTAALQAPAPVDTVMPEGAGVVDAVMSDWASGDDWWTGEPTAEEVDEASPQPAAVALGLGLITSTRVRRRTDRREHDRK